MTETAVYAAGRRLLARRRRQAHGAADPPHALPATSRCPRARSTPARRCRDGGARDRRRDRLARRPRRSARRLELHAAERREKIVHYWAAEVDAMRAIRTSTFVPNDEIAALEWVTHQEGAQLPQLPASTSRSSSTSPSSSTRACSRTFAIIALRHGKASAARTGTARTPPGRSPQRGAQAGGRDRRPARSRSAPRKIISQPRRRAASRRSRRSSAATGIADRQTHRLISQDAWEDGQVAMRAASSASACERASPRCSAATARCCPRS